MKNNDRRKRGPQPRLSPETREAIRQEYVTVGTAHAELAWRYGVSQSAIQHLLRDVPKAGRPRPMVPADGCPLAPRHLVVLPHLVGVQNYRAIAKRLHLAHLTVRMYVWEMYQATGVHTRTELVELAAARGWMKEQGAVEA